MLILDVIILSSVLGLELFLNVVLTSVILIVVIALVICTSPLWVPLGLLWTPMIIILGVLIRYTKFKTYIVEWGSKVIHFLIFRYRGFPKKTLWSNVYSLLARFLPRQI